MPQASSPAILTRRALFGAGALMMVGVPLARATPAASPSWLSYEQRLSARLGDAGGGHFETGFAKDLLAHTNRFRTAQGLRPLAWSEGLAASARAHVADMVQRGYFAHQSPEGFSHSDRVSLLNREECGQSAENLAYRADPTGAVEPAQFQRMWENSPGHRQNLTNAAFVQAGYGAVRIGSALYAAGVYGDGAIRLGRALPLNVETSTQVAAAMERASPSIRHYSLTAPGGQAGAILDISDPFPALSPGLWQLRPLNPTGAGAEYFVLSGPVFNLA